MGLVFDPGHGLEAWLTIDEVALVGVHVSGAAAVDDEAKQRGTVAAGGCSIEECLVSRGLERQLDVSRLGLVSA